MFLFRPIDGIGGILYDVIGLLMILILVDIVISNIIAFGGKISPYHPVVKFVRAVVDPILNPIRRLLPPPHKTGGWDFAPMIAILLLSVLRQALFSGTAWRM